jgi:LPXTG-motif cell wall-anchored protein
LGQLINRRRRAIAGLASMFGGAACLVATIPGQASADPPGNNGTVKVDGIEFDDHPDNEPHVGCIFQIDWYGFDEGDLFSDVTFEVHPPTGKPEVILTDEVFIGEDDNSGGGSEAGLDASETYDLTDLLQGFDPHPQQGWHVKLTVNNDGSQGADVKHKVFWVSGCETPPTTSTSTTSTTEEPTTTSTTEEPTTTSTTEEPTTTSTTEEPTTTSTTEEPTTTSTTEEPTTTSTTEEPTTTSTTEEPTTTSTTEKPTTTSTTEGPTTTSTTEGPTTTSTTEGPTTSSTEAPTTSSSESTSTTAVAPSSSTTSAAVSAGGQLPKTGGESQALLVAAGITLLVGGGALLASAKLGQKRLADA